MGKYLAAVRPELVEGQANTSVKRQRVTRVISCKVAARSLVELIDLCYNGRGI
jgi:hypothetical protein